MRIGADSHQCCVNDKMFLRKPPDLIFAYRQNIVDATENNPISLVTS